MGRIGLGLVNRINLVQVQLTILERAVSQLLNFVIGGTSLVLHFSLLGTVRA
jgi:hypothetical protein